MKFLKQINNIIVIAGCLITLSITSCTKVVPPKTAAPAILVGFHFHTYLGGTLVDPVAYPTQYVSDSLGRLLNLQVAQFYVTNIAVHIYNGSWHSLNNIILKRVNNEIYPLDTMPSGSMDSVRFTVGLGNALNSQSPSGFSPASAIDSVLSTTEQTAMWGSGKAGIAGTASGYTFMNVQGYDSTDHLPFSYQIGGYGDTVNVALAVPGGFNFSPVLNNGGVNLIHIYADYGVLLQALHPITNSNNNSTFYGPNPAPSNLLLQSIKKMFNWECLPPINC